ncbi:Hypothetical protein NTJ_02825, partial [Nesidiocoris tenuis]
MSPQIATARSEQLGIPRSGTRGSRLVAVQCAGQVRVNGIVRQTGRQASRGINDRHTCPDDFEGSTIRTRVIICLPVLT